MKNSNYASSTCVLVGLLILTGIVSNTGYAQNENTGVLLVNVDAECHLIVDGEPIDTLSAGESRKVAGMIEGNHIIECVSTRYPDIRIKKTESVYKNKQRVVVLYLKNSVDQELQKKISKKLTDSVLPQFIGTWETPYGSSEKVPFLNESEGATVSRKIVIGRDSYGNANGWYYYTRKVFPKSVRYNPDRHTCKLRRKILGTYSYNFQLYFKFSAATRTNPGPWYSCDGTGGDSFNIRFVKISNGGITGYYPNGSKWVTFYRYN